MEILFVTQTGRYCHALSFIQQIPMPFIGLRGIVRLEVTIVTHYQFVTVGRFLDCSIVGLDTLRLFFGTHFTIIRGAKNKSHNTGLFEMTVGVSTTCHTQYT